MSAPMAYRIGSRWHLREREGKTLCDKIMPLALVQRPAVSVPASRRCRTCWGVVEIIVALAGAEMELDANGHFRRKKGATK